MESRDAERDHARRRDDVPGRPRAGRRLVRRPGGLASIAGGHASTQAPRLRLQLCLRSPQRPAEADALAQRPRGPDLARQHRRARRAYRPRHLPGLRAPPLGDDERHESRQVALPRSRHQVDQLLQRRRGAARLPARLLRDTAKPGVRGAARRIREEGLAVHADRHACDDRELTSRVTGRGDRRRHAAMNSAAHGSGHGHSHGLVHDSIKRSREGIRAVLISLAVLGLAAVAQTVIFALSGSVALLADLIHNFGDALTAVPLGIAFLLRSERAERGAGLFVVAAIFISALVAGFEAVDRLIHPDAPDHLAALAAAGAVGYVGNWVAARVRTRTGRRLDSPALVADGAHARADAYVSLGVIASAAVVALGAPIADPLIGLTITLVILRITWQSWRTVRGRDVQRP